MVDFDKLITRATAEREVLIHRIADLGATVGETKQVRASLLAENHLDGGELAIQRINEKLHNARRVLNAWNRRRENLDYMLAYIAEDTEGGTE